MDGRKMQVSYVKLSAAALVVLFGIAAAHGVFHHGHGQSGPYQEGCGLCFLVHGIVLPALTMAISTPLMVSIIRASVYVPVLPPRSGWPSLGRAPPA